MSQSIHAQWLSSDFDDGDMASDLAEALTFQKYPTYDQYVEIMQGFARDYPQICLLDTFGTSLKGRLLLAVKISDNIDEDEEEASFLYSSTMHGNELVGYVLMLRLIDTLLKGYGNDGELTGLVDNLAIWINPLSNPDGTFHNDNGLSVLNSIRGNFNGVDLNRDFPDPHSGEPNDTAGREIENRHMMMFMEEHGFTLSANIHSGVEVVNYPWDHTYDRHIDDAWYRFVSREYADEARAVDPEYMNLFTDGITHGADWFVMHGGRQDYVNYYLGGREVTLELCNTMLLDSEQLEAFWDKNRRSLINYISQCMYGIRGNIRSLESGMPVRARVEIPDYDSNCSVVYSKPSTGAFYRLIKEGVYNLVVSAEGYVNDTIRDLTVWDHQPTSLEIILDSVVPTVHDTVVHDTAFFDMNDMAGDLEEALTFSKYPTYDQYLEIMQQFASEYPSICRLDTFGTTVQGRLLLALKISDRAEEEEPEPAFLFSAGLRGADLAGFVLLLRLADHLVQAYGTNGEVTALVDNMAIWITPLLNPDGTYYSDNNESVTTCRSANSSGIDLWLDFPDPGVPEPDDPAGRAMETQFIMQFLQSHRFNLSAGISSGAEAVKLPWDHRAEPHADNEWFISISSAYAAQARNADPGYMKDFENGIVTGADWEMNRGGKQDYVNYYLGGREISLMISEEAKLDAYYLDDYWIRNRQPMLNLMKQTLYGIRGRVTGRESGDPVKACICIPEHDSLYSVVYSSEVQGDFYRMIQAGNYDLVVSAEGYLNDTIRDVEVRDHQAIWLNIQLDSAVSTEEPVIPVFDIEDMATDLEEALTFLKYPSYDQYVGIMQYFASTYPQICRLDTIGTSIQGRLLLALKISDQVHLDEPEPKFLYTSTIHGDELVGYILTLRLADYLLRNYGVDDEVTGLVDNLAIWINPMSNPDGTYYDNDNSSVINSRRRNISGIDLNRDFPDPAGGEPDDTTGRQPETKYMMQFLKEHRFNLSANLHTGAEVVNYPWDHTFDLHADDPWYRFISREYADEARAVDQGYMQLFENGITNGAMWYVIYGGRQDYVNYYLGGREVTLELSNENSVDSDSLDAYWNKNRRSLLNYMAQATYGIHGRVTDGATGLPLEAMIHIPRHDSAYSVVHSSPVYGDFYRYIKEGAYDVTVSADGYMTDTTIGVQVNDYQVTRLDVALNAPGSSGSDMPAEGPSVHLYPNPAGDEIFISLSGISFGTVQMSIITPEGHTVLEKRWTNSGQAMPVRIQGLNSGIYFVRIISGELSKTFKIVKQ